MSVGTEVVPASDPRIVYVAPQPVDRTQPSVRLERFPAVVRSALIGDLGPSANVRSSSGCSVHVQTDSPVIGLRLARLRHHQMIPVGISADITGASSSPTWDSEDLRDRAGDLELEIPTGCERGRPPVDIAISLPLISTCAIAGLTVLGGSRLLPPPVQPPPRWLAIGDSLVQGFSVQSPRQCWVHRLSRRLGLPAWNLGLGGMRIQAPVVAWAIEAQPWDLVTISLGSNHAWNPADMASVVGGTRELAERILAVRPQRAIWCLPPYKPCEDGLGPRDFAGVVLDRATGERAEKVRGLIRQTLAEVAPGIQVAEDLIPRDPRLFPDGLHPGNLGSVAYAESMEALIRGVPG